MAAAATLYRFHVHKLAPAWRLVPASGAAPPAGLNAEDWAFTREREAGDTNPDVRTTCTELGYCLIKIGGSFEDVAQDASSGRGSDR